MIARYKPGCGQIVFVALALLAATPTGVVLASGAKDEAARYEACMARTRSDPQKALGEATAWSREKGGNAAKHCAAVALIELKRFEDAGTRLEQLASAMGDSQQGIRAEVLAQAGLAWLMQGSLARAVDAQSAALEIRPDDPEILIDRAIALASGKQYWESVDDLTRVIEASPDRVDALTYRAAAWRHLESLELSRDDIKRALVIDPDYAPALVERGNLNKLAGDIEGARHDWRKAVDIAPTSKAAEAAKLNLKRLDQSTN